MDGDAVRLAVSTRAAWRHPSNIHSSWAQAGPCWPSLVFIADYLTGVSGNTIDHNIDIMLYGPLVRHIMHHTYTGILVLCHGRSHDTHMTPTGGVAECCGHRPISAKRRDPKQINNELPQHRRPPPQHFCSSSSTREEIPFLPFLVCPSSIPLHHPLACNSFLQKPLPLPCQRWLKPQAKN